MIYMIKWLSKKDCGYVKKRSNNNNCGLLVIKDINEDMFTFYSSLFYNKSVSSDFYVPKKREDASLSIFDPSLL